MKTYKRLRKNFYALYINYLYVGNCLSLKEARNWCNSNSIGGLL